MREYDNGPDVNPGVQPQAHRRAAASAASGSRRSTATTRTCRTTASPTTCIEQLGKKHDKPFFLACGLHKPHMPWNVPQKYYDMFPLDSIELPPSPEDDLDDVPPAGVKMAKPDGDHSAMRRVRPLEGSGAGLPRRRSRTAT